MMRRDPDMTNTYSDNDGVNSLVHELALGINICFSSESILCRAARARRHRASPLSRPQKLLSCNFPRKLLSCNLPRKLLNCNFPPDIAKLPGRPQPRYGAGGARSPPGGARSPSSSTRIVRFACLNCCIGPHHDFEIVRWLHGSGRPGRVGSRLEKNGVGERHSSRPRAASSGLIIDFLYLDRRVGLIQICRHSSRPGSGRSTDIRMKCSANTCLCTESAAFSVVTETGISRTFYANVR